MSWNRSWAEYVPVAKRRAMAANEVAKLDKANAKNGKKRIPVLIQGRKMATTFWGEAWCNNLDRYSDFSNRLDRGKTYARNGSILDLQVEQGTVTALVSGSSLYKINIEIKTLQPKLWKNIKEDCAKSIHSMIDLLRGKLSNEVLARLTEAKVGLFPEPKEIDLHCSCPDYAYLCKHLAAVMYGIGNRLDNSPELLFLLRGVEIVELISEVVTSKNLSDSLASSTNSDLQHEDLGTLFGIELVESSTKLTKAKPKKPTLEKQPGEKTAKKSATTKRSTPKETVAERSSDRKPAQRGAAKKTANKHDAEKVQKNTVRKRVPITAPTNMPANTIANTRAKGLPDSLRLGLEQTSRTSKDAKSKPR